MLHVLSIWLLVAAFFGAAVFNAIGTPATKNSFVRWGYPQWWCRVTGGLEMVGLRLRPGHVLRPPRPPTALRPWKSTSRNTSHGLRRLAEGA